MILRVRTKVSLAWFDVATKRVQEGCPEKDEIRVATRGAGVTASQTTGCTTPSTRQQKQGSVGPLFLYWSSRHSHRRPIPSGGATDGWREMDPIRTISLRVASLGCSPSTRLGMKKIRRSPRGRTPKSLLRPRGELSINKFGQG